MNDDLVSVGDTTRRVRLLIKKAQFQRKFSNPLQALKGKHRLVHEPKAYAFVIVDHELSARLQTAEKSDKPVWDQDFDIDIKPDSTVSVKFFDERLAPEDDQLDDKAVIGEAKVDVTDMFKDSSFAVKKASCSIERANVRTGTVEIELDRDPTRYVLMSLKPVPTGGQTVDKDVETAKSAITIQGGMASYYKKLQLAIGMAEWVWDLVSDVTAIPFAGIPSKVLSAAHKALVDQGQRDKDLLQLVDSMYEILETVNSAREIATRPQLKAKLGEIITAVTNCAKFIQESAQQSYSRRLVKDTLSDDRRDQIDAYKQQFLTLTRRYEQELRLQEISDKKLDADSNQRPGREPPPWTPLTQAPAHGDRSNICYSNTRKSVRDEIVAWSLDLEDRRILWLRGIAGSGKSAITNTIAHQLEQEGRLAGCFFFSRDREADGLNRPDEVITTIAAQFLNKHKEILKMIDIPDTIAKESFSFQFDRLIIGISKHISPSRPLIIMLEAADECGDAAQRASLLNSLVVGARLLPPYLKLYISSRPEPDLIGVLDDTSCSHVVRSDTQDSEVELDIRSYVENQLSQSRRIHDSQGWPLEEAINFLTEQSSHLFIWADVAVKYILDYTHDPLEQLNLLRKDASQMNRGADRLGHLYRTVVETSNVSNGSLYILGTMVTLQDPLTMHAIDGLLGLGSQRPLHDTDGNSSSHIASRYILLRLKSILRDGATSLQAVRLLHPSLVDFFTDESRAKGLFIDPKVYHTMLLGRCISTMRTYLCGNICKLRDKTTPNANIPEATLSHSIPAHLRYACRFWISHLEYSAANMQLSALVRNFVFQHLLQWIEAMSLMDLFEEVPHVLFRLKAWLVKAFKQRDSTSIAKHAVERVMGLLGECDRMLLKFHYPLASSANQVYMSALLFSPARKLLASTFSPLVMHFPKLLHGTIVDWSNLLCTLQGHRSPVSCVAFSPNSKQIVSGSYDSTVRIWDVLTGHPIGQPLIGHTGAVTCVVFSTDGNHIASGSQDRTVRIWDVQSGRQVGDSFKHGDGVCSVSMSPDDSQIGSGCEDNTVRIWDLRSGRAVFEPLQSHKDHVTAVAFSGDGKYIVSGSHDKTIQIWDVKTGRPIGDPLRGHRFHVICIAFSPDGKRIASGSWDNTVLIWDALSGRQMGEPMKHDSGVKIVSFSPDGNRIMSACQHNIVHIWDSRTGQPIGEPLRGLDGDFKSIAFSVNGKLIASSGFMEKTIRIWRFPSTRILSPRFQGHEGSVESVAFSVDGIHIVSGSSDTTVRIWDAQTGQPIGQPLHGHRGSVECVAFSRDGERIASGSWDDTVRIWDAHSGVEIGKPMVHDKTVNSLFFSPDGKHIVSGCNDHMLYTWDSRTGEPIGEPLRGHEGGVNSVVFTRDGKFIVSGSADKTIRIWDAESRQAIIEPLQGHEHQILSVACSSDGKRVVSSSMDGTIRLWDSSSGEPIGEPMLSDGGDWDTVVAFYSDDEHIVSGCTDNTICIRNIHSGQLVRRWHGHEDWVNTIAISADGRNILTGSNDMTIRIWESPLDISIGESGIGGEIEDSGFNYPEETESGAARSTLHSAWSTKFIIAPRQTWKFDLSQPALDLTECQDGWITDHEGRNILWVPDEFRGIWGPAHPSRLILGRQGTVDVVLDISDYLEDLYANASPMERNQRYPTSGSEQSEKDDDVREGDDREQEEEMEQQEEEEEDDWHSAHESQ